MFMVSTYVKKLDATIDRDYDAFPQTTREHLAEYGFKQIVADSHASVKREAYADGEAGDKVWTADVRAAVDARLAQLDSGDFTRTRTADPGTARIRDAARKAGVKLDAIDPEKLVAWMKRQAEQGRAA